MNLLHDYYYRFPNTRMQMPGRCRVRIFKRRNGTHSVLLTELETNTGESISSACERIATDLVISKNLNPKTTRWIQHDATQNDRPQVFEEVQFTWRDNTAIDPEWQQLSDEHVESLTGDSLDGLGQLLGDDEMNSELVAGRRP